MQQLTEKQSLLLKNLGELLIYGNQYISGAELDIYKTRQKKSILFLTMGAVQSYSEAILKLMKPDNIYDKAAEVLFRSLTEAYINVNYIYCNKTKENAMLFIADSEHDKIDFARKYAALWKKYPKWNLVFGDIKKVSDWDTFISNRQQFIQKVEKRYKQPLKKLPNLLDRAIAFDKQYKNNRKLPKDIVEKRLERNSLEKNYVLYYKYFSSIVHLTMPGLEQFMKKDENGRSWLEIDGKTSNIERVIPITFIVYMAILVHFLKQFKLYDRSSFVKFKNMVNTMIK